VLFDHLDWSGIGEADMYAITDNMLAGKPVERWMERYTVPRAIEPPDIEMEM